MQQPIYSAQEEQTLMSRLWSPRLANDPLAFTLFVYPWGQVGTPLERFKGPRKWQREILTTLRDHIAANNGTLDPEVFRLAVASGRGIGKSALVSWLVLWFLTTRIGGSVIVSANSENQLRSVTWAEITKWSAMLVNAHWFEISATRLMPAKWLTDLVERDLKKGTRYWSCDGKLWSEENPDGYAGIHNWDGVLLVFDESSGIPDSIWSVSSGFFSEPTKNRFWVAFSNPRRNSGYFYECFNAKRDFWLTRQIDAREVEGTDQKIYEQIIAEYGSDSYQANVEIYGTFPSEGDDQFISSGLVDDAMKRAQYKDEMAPITIGVDPARFGTDATVIAIRKGRDLVEIRRFRGDDTMVVVGHIIDAIDEFKPAVVTIDEGGLGAGVVDRLKEQRYNVRGLNFGSKAKNPKMFGNKRAEIWGWMKDWLKTASIPTDKLLKSDLIGPKMIPDSSGVIYLEKKSAMKSRGLASPDAADAIALSLAFPVARREQKTAKVIRSYSQSGMATSWMGS